MDYLYINAIVNEVYANLECSCPFPEVYRNDLHKYVVNDDLLKSTAVDNMISYFSIKEPNRAPLLVLANVERQKTCASVGRAVQCLGWEWSQELICTDMGKLFSAGFYAESEYVEQAKQGTAITLPARARENSDSFGIALSYKVKRAILTGVFLRWLRHDDPVRIAVPAGVDYNAYVWQAVEQIYGLFPVALRLEAGFCSFLPDVSKTSDRIYLGFVPEAQADAKTIFLDGSRQAGINAMEKGTQRKNLDQLIHFLCIADDATRNGFLEELYEDVEGSGEPQKILAVAPKDYLSLGEAVGLLLQEGTMEQLLPSWQSFYQNYEKMPVRIRSRVISKIHGMIQVEDFCQMLKNACAEQTGFQEIVGIFSEYKPFYADNAALAEGAWDTMLAKLHEAGAKAQDVFRLAVENREALGALVTGRRLDDQYRLSVLEELACWQSQTMETEEAAQQRYHEVVARMNEIVSVDSAHAEELLAECGKYQKALNDIQNDFRYKALRGEYEELLRQPVEQTLQIQEVIRFGRDLLDQIMQAPELPSFAQLKQELQTYLEQLGEKVNSSSAQYAHILGLVQSGKPYFSVLDDVQAADRTTLEAEQVRQIGMALDTNCPTSLQSYRDQFKKHYHDTMSLYAISKLPDFICRRVVQDICRLNTLHVSCDIVGSTIKNLDEIRGAEYFARKISPSCNVQVNFKGDRNGLWFKRMLDLTHTRQTMENQSEFETVFGALVDSGVYSGAQMQKCLEMMYACGLKCNNLFEKIMQGKFPDSTEEQYHRAFETIIAHLGKKQPEEYLKNKESQIKDKDPVAKAAFRSFMGKGGKSAGKTPLAMLIALIGVSVVALGLLIALIIVAVGSGKKQELPPAETTVPTQTTAPVETKAPETAYPPLLQQIAQNGEIAEKLFGLSAAGFDAYADAVKGAVKKLDEPKFVEAYMATDAQDMRDARFFWTCWLYAADTAENAETEFSVENYQNTADAILQLICQYVPEATEEEPAATTETTDATTGTTATESTEANTPTEPSVEEILQAVCTAAESQYAAANANARELKLYLALFGADSSKDFAQHREAVETLLAEDTEHAATDYRELPGDLELNPMPGEDPVTWNEYFFWKCWVRANFGEEQDINACVTEVLRLIHALPDVPQALDQQGDSENTGEQNTSEASTEPTEQDVFAQMGIEQVPDAAQSCYETALRIYHAVQSELSDNR